MGAPEKQMIEVPAIMIEGFNAMLVGKKMETRSHGGFAFCPYQVESIERANWLAGCVDATFETANAEITGG